MSDSRLEKFIYAICSMDVSDLPVPLSRIEKLWNCLITGETPDFEPLSRNEKYLMAMLDRYDISNLPAPMSRGEKLLYKIAVGETDLSDVPGYLSRYEELLKYLIENGGISEGDFEYVLYTLNQSLSTLYTTAEKPVKSAILKGNTLVNLVNDVTSNEVGNYTNSPCKINVIRNLQNETLTIIFNVISLEIPDGADGILRIGGGWSGQIRFKPTLGVNKVLYNYNQTSNSWLGMYSNSGAYNLGQRITISDVMVLEGDYTNVDIPYFEGMKSVQMPVLTTTGKNLFDGNLINEELGDNSYIDENNKLVVTGGEANKTPLMKGKFKEKTSYTLSYTFENVDTNVSRYRLQFKYTDGTAEIPRQSIKGNGNVTLTTDNKKTIDYLWCTWGDDPLQPTTFSNIQMEESSTATSYEPFKSNILTVNEDVTLRGIDTIKDELNCLTGEVTERIKEVVLYGSETWAMNMPTSEYSKPTIRVSCSKLIKGGYASNDKLISDKIPVTSGSYNDEIFGISALHDEALYIQIPRTLIGLDLEENTPTVVSQKFKDWLTGHGPVKVYYPLATESVKTVDLTVVDQDNQPTELGTFENVTHVSLVAENLIPEVEMEVATNLLEDTVFSLTDTFNTLYPTAEKPVKSAILKGNTIKKIGLEMGSYNGNLEKIPMDNRLRVKDIVKGYDVIKIDCKNGYQAYIRGIGEDSGWNQSISMTFTAEKPFVILFKKNDESVFSQSDYGNIIEYTNIAEISDNNGNELVSVKMPVLKTTGKNLFDGKLEYGLLNANTGLPINSNDYVRSQNFIPINCETITFTVINGECGLSFCYYDENKNYISSKTKTKVSDDLSIPEGVAYLKIRTYPISDESITNNLNTQIQIEEGKVATEYEPYQSNILTVNEDVTLLSNESVYDELDLLTGKLTQRIDEDGEILTQEVVKTVDLTVVDQDGNVTTLKTFDDTTHVLLNSEGLIPTAVLTVRTKIPSGSSTSLLMDDISTEQHQLETTVDEQSNNVDATMIATTEIYEETL